MKNLFLALIISATAVAQVVTWEPIYFTEDSSVTIYFNATEGSGGLADFDGDIYAHTGLITSSSSSSSDWRYVIADWTTNKTKALLNRESDNLYSLKITPSVFEYYLTSEGRSLDPGEEILQLAFVFRNASGTREGKTAGGGDIFVDLRTGVNITTPADRPYQATLNETFAFQAVGSVVTDTLKLFIDNELITTTTRDTLNYDITVSTFKQRIKIIGTTEIGIEVSDSTYYFVNPEVVEEELPIGLEDGITYGDDDRSVTLVLYANNKDFVYVIGDFNRWEIDPDYFMKRTPDGEKYWLTINNLEIGKEYGMQYLVEGDLRISDPYAEKVLDPWNDSYIPESVYPNLKPYPSDNTTGIVSVLQTAQADYQWQIENFERPSQDELVIYELLVRDFVETHSYQTLIDTLDYLERLGVNAIELMPIYEFEGNSSWGYNPSFMFAVDKYYGTENDLKQFIDECHARGIAVILDMVLNHQFGQSPLVQLYWDSANNRPSADNPWFNQVAKHDFNVGYDMNHESELTQQFVDRVNQYWLAEFKFDGFRYDLSKGFTQKNTLGNTGAWGQYDASRIALLKRMADEIRTYDDNAYLILEHFAENSEEKELSDYGFMLWGNMNYNYNEATMGYHDNNKSDFSWISYQERGWNDPHVVGYMESHDEERLMFKNLEYGNSSGSYDITNLVTALQRVKMAAAFFFTIPGPKMIWQFGELGYDISIDQNGRTGEKPILWQYQDNVYREKLYKTFAALINLRNNYEAFQTDDFILGVSNRVKRIRLNHESMNVNILGNFDVAERTTTGTFQNTGMWYDYFSGDSIEVADVSMNITLAPGEFHIYTTEKLPTPDGDVISDVEEFKDNELPSEFVLDQNYPNPFNPTTTIKFSIPQSSFVDLRVYNILGEEVSRLVSEELSAGQFRIKWSGKDSFGKQLSSGIYFYRLQAGNNVQTRKMILLK